MEFRATQLVDDLPKEGTDVVVQLVASHDRRLLEFDIHGHCEGNREKTIGQD